jgi:hypothetical protein
MRTMLIAGTAGLFLALGGASAYAVPPNSPYATMVPPGAVDYNAPGYNYGTYYNPGVVEGRSAYVEEPGYVYRAPAYRPYYGYDYDYRYRAPFPFSLLPWNW